MKIGSHVGMSSPDYLVGAVKEALSYEANTFMFYTGAPQNTRRTEIEKLKIEEALVLMKENNIDLNDVVVHAPYIINLGNTIKEETYELAVEFLIKELDRVKAIGCNKLVLHPGAHVKAGVEAGLDSIVKGLDEVLSHNHGIDICLETMAGKGTELGRSFEEIKYMIDNVKDNTYLKVCLDTCHVHDAGYDLSDFDSVLESFDSIIGLDRLAVIHVNDSKNERGASKDRHENLGYGHIGFDNLSYIVNHPKVSHVVKILETPWVDDQPVYKKEIEMLRSQVYQEGYIDVV